MGLDAVKQKNYPLAISYFTQSAESDSVSVGQLPLIHYNLGVCYYRTAVYDSARDSFKRAMLSNVLLWRSVFNLALIAEKQQNWLRAEQLYKKIVMDSDSAELVVLAKDKLETLPTVSFSNVLIPTEASDILPMQWVGLVSASVGRDSDVINPQNQSGSGSDDTFNEIYAGVYRPFMVKDDSYLLFDARVYSLSYDSINDYDSRLLSVGLEQNWAFQQQQWSLGFLLEYSTVGDDDYLLERTFYLSNQWQLGSTASVQLKYHYRDLEALEPRFDPLDGNRQELQLSWFYPITENSRWKSRLFVMDDDREDLRDRYRYTSFSSDRKGVYGAWDYSSNAWRWVVYIEYRHSHYDSLNILENFSEIIRKDDRRKAGINGQYSLSPTWSVSFDYGYTNNRSNIAAYDYHGEMITLGVNYEF